MYLEKLLAGYPVAGYTAKFVSGTTLLIIKLLVYELVGAEWTVQPFTVPESRVQQMVINSFK